MPEPPSGRRSRWAPSEEPPAGARAARHRLADAIRRLNGLLLDTDLPESELVRAAEAAEAFADRLAEGPRGAVHWGYAESATTGGADASLDRSPVAGAANAIAPPLALRADGDAAVGTCTFGDAYEGPPGHVHGGWVAAAFDELLGMAQSITGNPGMTGTLTVRYRRPTPLAVPVDFRGWVERVEGRKIFTAGTLHAAGELCAQAEGIFISVGQERFRALSERA
jgi:acyl-coenzyme A thioesterase PaaI-like protein